MNRGEALGLPPGSVRAILTIMLVLIVSALFFIKGAVPEMLGGGMLLALNWYFNKDRQPEGKP